MHTYIHVSIPLSNSFNGTLNSHGNYFRRIFNDMKKVQEYLTVHPYLSILYIYVWKSRYWNSIYIKIQVNEKYYTGTYENDSGRHGCSWGFISGDISLLLLTGPLSDFFPQWSWIFFFFFFYNGEKGRK